MSGIWPCKSCQGVAMTLSLHYEWFLTKLLCSCLGNKIHVYIVCSVRKSFISTLINISEFWTILFSIHSTSILHYIKCNIKIKCDFIHWCNLCVFFLWIMQFWPGVTSKTFTKLLNKYIKYTKITLGRPRKQARWKCSPLNTNLRLKCDYTPTQLVSVLFFFSQQRNFDTVRKYGNSERLPKQKPLIRPLFNICMTPNVVCHKEQLKGRKREKARERMKSDRSVRSAWSPGIVTLNCLFLCLL